VFRGEIASDTRAIDGLWITQSTPFDAARAHTTRLLRAGTFEWRGMISPNEEGVQLYLLVQSDGAGATALLRNPDGSVGDGRFAVDQKGCDITLKENSGAARQIAGRLTHGTLTLSGTSLGRSPVRLSVTQPQLASGFLPRRNPPLVLTPVPQTGDGWRTGSPVSVRLDAERIAGLVRTLATVDPSGRGVPLVHSFLVARHGRLVVEEYFFGYDRDHLHDLRSASKTFASVMVGVAQERGVRLRSNSPIDLYLPQYRAIFTGEPAKRAIRLKHLMTMTSGLDCDDNDAASTGGEGVMQGQQQERDWYRYILSRRLVHSPGSHAAYCSGGVNLIGAVLRQAAGRAPLDLFRRDVAPELQIKNFSWPLTPTGEAYLGGGVHMRPRDLLKFGELYLRGGIWNGRRLLPRQWVAESVTCQVFVAGACADGYDWHLNQVRAGGRLFSEFEANGNGGQLLMAIPDLDLLVQFTAANYNQYGVWRRFREVYLPEVIEAARP
jgi:CubicO group peptidase (beta-lactamase class C family)